MAQPYLTDLQRIVERGASPEGRDAITYKHFFSGAAAYVQGSIFASLTPVGLAFKLPEASCNAFLADGALPLQYFPAAPVKRGYVRFADPEQLAPDRIAELIAESVDHVLGS